MEKENARRQTLEVMQELMSKAARMVRQARLWVLGLGANDAAFAVFQRHWRELDGPGRAPPEGGSWRWDRANPGKQG